MINFITTKKKEFFNKKLDNNHALRRLASLSFIVGGATSSMSILHYPNHVHSTLVTLIIIKFPMICEVPKWKWMYF